MTTMGERLKEARTWMGLTLRTVGNKMGVSRERIRQLESYEYISDAQVERLCASLGVNDTWLKTGEGQMFTRDVPKSEKNDKPRHSKKTAEHAERERAEREALKPVRAEYVRKLRMDAGITQKELAAALNVGQTQISAWECGKHFISDATMERIESIIKTGSSSTGSSSTKTGNKRQIVTRRPRGIKPVEPFITVCKSGLLLNKPVMEKLGGCDYAKVYYDIGEKVLIIMATEKGEKGAQRIYKKGSPYKLNNARVRKVAEKLLGFNVGDDAYRIEGAWTHDEEYDYWRFDMSRATCSSRNTVKESMQGYVVNK